MTKETTIILEESIHAKHYHVSDETDSKKSMLIHRDEFEKVIGLIEKYIPKTKEEEEKENQHNTITILGTRGSGKTSFLLSIKEYLSSNKASTKNEHERTSEVEILEIIDPTLIEDKGHVFLNVISVIKELIDKKFDKQECSPNTHLNSPSRKEWRTALNRLAAGLPSIDDITDHKKSNWQDPEFIMDNGLRDITASRKLAKNFNEFLKISLTILEKRVFLLMFDDIDVDSTKGWAVLETIRKYFTGARLITIVSGDIRLYSTVVRQKKWQNFGADILKHEGQELGKLSKFNDMITELESQYLQKVLQPSNRIHLYTIGEYKSYKEEAIFYVYESSKDAETLEKDGHEISKIYRKILKFFGVNNSYQVDAYSSFFLRLPLRTQVQFLSLFNLESGEYYKDNGDIMRITDLFIGDLNAKGIELGTIKNNKNLNRIVLKFLLEEKKLEELYQLQPITTEDSLNASLISLNLLLSYNIQTDPYLIFDYFIKVGYTRNLLPTIGYKDGKASTITPSMEDMCENTFILNDNVLKDVTGKIIAYVRGALDNKEDVNSQTVSKAGTIPLFAQATTAKKSISMTSDRIDSVLKSKKASYIEWMLVYMPLSSNQYVYKQSSILTYSSYLLLGAIGELIRKVKLNDEDNGFTELSQLRGYIMPDFRRGNNESSLDNNHEDSTQDFPERKLEDANIEGQFKNWVEKYPKNIKISAHLLGKIATRFFYALINLENNGTRKKKLGDVFPAHILAFMNAVLIEDSRENSTIASSLNLNNTNYDDRIFLNNLQKVITKPQESTQLIFSKWMLSCPLLLAYLNPGEQLKPKLATFCDGIIDEKIFETDLSQYFNEISIRSEELSLDNTRHHAEILQKLADEKFDLTSLKPEDAKTLSDKLMDYGITKVTAESIKKINRTISKGSNNA